MRFAVWDHAGKAAYLTQKLREAGHTLAANLEETELLLVDHDGPWAHPRPELIRLAAENNIPVVMYPHGGQPGIFPYDGHADPDPRVTLRLEHGHGVIDVAENLGLELRQHACGWLFSPTAPFQQKAHARTVLFAPQHPNMETIASPNGHDPAPSLNQHIYRQLLKTGYRIVVLHVGPPWRNGLWAHPAARFVDNHQMAFQTAYQTVLDADVVVGAGTVGALGVALGRPTVMFGQDDFSDYIDGQYRESLHVEEYREKFRYPLDAGDADLDYLIAQACYGTPETMEWRRNHIGDDGTSEAVYVLEGVVAESSADNVTIQGVKQKSAREAPVHATVQGATARATVKG